MVGLDTSVVLRLLVGVPEEHAEAARRFLEGASEPALVSDLVVAESYFALRHHYDVTYRAAVDALTRLLADHRIRASAAARVALADAAGRESPGLIDRLIHAGYRHEGVVLLTFDRDAARLEKARLLQ